VAEIINSLGAKAQLVGERAYMVDPTSLSSHDIAEKYGRISRASSLFIPALLSRFGEVSVPFPGGDKIGARPLDRHFDGLAALGVEVKFENELIHAKTKGLHGATYCFPKSTHTGTETLIMTAVKAKGVTLLQNAALETEIDDLIEFLNTMGAKIERLPNRVIKIEGVEHLHGAIHQIMPDHNQVVSFACAAIATKGDVIVENARPSDLTAFLTALDQAHAGYQVGNFGVRFFYKGPLQGAVIATGIHPGFKTDWQPLWVTMMTQATGVSVLHETVLENRFAYVKALNEMGASIQLFNPEVDNPDKLYNFNLENDRPEFFHAARIVGPSALHGGEFDVQDLRHGATLMIAGLTATGETTLHDSTDHIDRGYEKLDRILHKLGANIQRY